MLSQVELEPRAVTTGMRRILIAAAILVLGVGLPLFFFPKNTDVDFAWTITSPIMAAALGACYLSASVLEVLAARASTWANARAAVSAVFIFTVLTLAITFLHIDRFHLDVEAFSARFIAWVWVAVYVIVPIILGILWFRQTRTPGPDPEPVAPMSPLSRAIWFGSSPMLLLLGAYLLVAPFGAAAFWPWALTALTGRVVGAWLIAFSVLSAHAGLENDHARLYPIFPALTLFAVLQGIVLVRFYAELDWARPSAWVYALVLASWLAIGLQNWMSVRKHISGPATLGNWVMSSLARLFGLTFSNMERNLAAEPAVIAEISEKIVVLQVNAATEQRRPIGRGTHVKGVCARAQFEVFDVSIGRERALAARLARGIYTKPGTYPAIVRFANADSNVNSDLKADMRSLSFSVELAPDGGRQDYSMQNATTFPINDAHAFLVLMKVLTAPNPAKGVWSLPWRDKVGFTRTLALVQLQARQAVRPYQQLRYWSTVPFRHGPADVVKYSATPHADNPARPLQKHNPNALQDELVRHLAEDSKMSSFDFALQLLDAERMTYRGKRRDTDFWIENASVEWPEERAPFHTVARLTLLPKSALDQTVGESTYFDVIGNSTPDSRPLGSINRARYPAEVASREARMKKAAADLE